MPTKISNNTNTKKKSHTRRRRGDTKEEGSNSRTSKWYTKDSFKKTLKKGYTRTKKNVKRVLANKKVQVGISVLGLGAAAALRRHHTKLQQHQHYNIEEQNNDDDDLSAVDRRQHLSQQNTRSANKNPSFTCRGAISRLHLRFLEEPPNLTP